MAALNELEGYSCLFLKSRDRKTNLFLTLLVNLLSSGLDKMLFVVNLLLSGLNKMFHLLYFMLWYGKVGFNFLSSISVKVLNILSIGISYL